MEADSREMVLRATIEVFQKKGMKFTMDDVARQLKMSKKTLYKLFCSKEEMFLATVDYLFDGIRRSKEAVTRDDSLSTLEKVRRILGVLPESYKNLDFGQLYQLKEDYPRIYEQVENRLETGWEETLALLQQAIEEGVVRPVQLPIVKVMFESALEQFFRRDVLVRNQITYRCALEEVVDILVDGIAVRG